MIIPYSPENVQSIFFSSFRNQPARTFRNFQHTEKQEYRRKGRDNEHITPSVRAPVTWLMLSEIFPLRLRGLGMGVTVFCLWIVNFIVGLTFPVLLANIGLSATFFIFVLLGITIQRQKTVTPIPSPRNRSGNISDSISQVTGETAPC